MSVQPAHPMQGHNNPPSNIEIVGEKARELYPHLFSRFEELTQKTGELPLVITNDDEAGRVGDFVKQVNENKKSLEAVRKLEKQPHLDMSKAVDGFFKKYLERLDKVLEEIRPRQSEYIYKKEEAERIRREEEAEKIRQEAAEKLRIAQEKEAEAKRIREEQEAAAKKAQEEIERKRREMEEKAAAERKRQEEELAALRQKQEEENRKKQEEIDRLKAEQAEKERLEREEKAKLKALEEERKAQEKENARQLKEAQDKAKELERQVKTQEREINREERETEKSLKDLEKVAKQTEREAERTVNQAIREENKAERLEKTASNAAQKSSRVRGDQGSLTVTSKTWTGELINRAELDLEALRHYIPEDALNQAIRSFVRAGGRSLRGAAIYEDEKVQTR